jgi:Ca-activated chloride channel homolog
MKIRAFGRARSNFLFRVRPVLLFLPAVVSLAAQTPDLSAGSAEPTRISVDVRVVVLHVSVWNNRRNIVSGLTRENFRITEDGVPQSIASFRPEELPVAVGLVIDNSSSMGRKLGDITNAAVAFAGSSNAEDEVFVIKFNEHVALDLPDTVLRSTPVARLEEAIRRPMPLGRTALYDAITAALGHLRESTRERKALVVISDGGDNASKTTLDGLLQQIWRSDVAVYTIGLFDEEDPGRHANVLRRIASASGGERYLPAGSSDAISICERIAHEIRNQYTISYSPSNQKFDSRLRSIKVKATGSRGERLGVRTRTGYIADPVDSEK